MKMTNRLDVGVLESGTLALSSGPVLRQGLSAIRLPGVTPAGGPGRPA